MKENFIKMFFLIIIMLIIAIPVEVLAATEVAPKGVELSINNITMTEKETKVIEATVNPSNATNKQITFSSSDKSIATVDKITKGVKVESGGKLSAGNTVYYMKTAVNNKVLSVDGGKTNNSTNIVMKDYEKKDSQKYEVVDAGNGYCIIRIKHSGKVLDVQREGKKNSTKVIQYKLNGNDNQLWELEDAGNGYYYIKSKDSGLYLDVQGGNANDGDKLIIYQKGNNKSNQKFKFVDTGETAKVEEFGMAKVTAKKDGTAKITAKTSNGKSANCKITVNSKITGGEAIAKSAVKLACSVAVAPNQNRYTVEWPGTRKYNSTTAAYIDARESLIPMGKSADGGEYASCDMGVATAVRYSKVDTKMEFNTIPNIWPYLRNSSKWKEVGTYKRPNSPTDLEPGDVLISGDPYYGHIFIYTGNKAVREKYPDSDANAYEAGYSSERNQSYYPRLFSVTKDTRNNIVFTIFRNINWNKAIYDDIT